MADWSPTVCADGGVLTGSALDRNSAKSVFGWILACHPRSARARPLRGRRAVTYGLCTPAVLLIPAPPPALRHIAALSADDLARENPLVASC